MSDLRNAENLEGWASRPAHISWGIIGGRLHFSTEEPCRAQKYNAEDGFATALPAPFDDLVNDPCEPRWRGQHRIMNMKIRLDAVMAEIAGTIDVNLLEYDSNFADLPRFNRLHFIFRSLARCDIARAEKYGRKVIRWRPSHRLKNYVGLKPRGIPDVFERIEAPRFFSTLADEFEEFLQTAGGPIEGTAFGVLRRLAMYETGLLEYRGKKNGLCQFGKPHPGGG